LFREFLMPFASSGVLFPAAVAPETPVWLNGFGIRFLAGRPRIGAIDQDRVADYATNYDERIVKKGDRGCGGY
jgi:hypothetical protein